MIKKVIYFIASKFNERDYNRFGVETLAQNGFPVEVWEFTPFLNAEAYKSFEVPDPIHYKNHRLFLSKKEAVNAILKLDDSVFVICLISYTLDTYSIYRALSKKNIKYGLFAANALPARAIANNTTYYFNKLKSVTVHKMIAVLFDHIRTYGLGIKGATLILAGSEQYKDYKKPLTKNSEVLWIHTLDYDLFLKEKENHVQIKNDTVVFLDEYLPFNSDFIYNREIFPATAEEYYPALCKFFEHLENNYNINIIIAAHPRALYEQHPSFFGNRPIIRGKTAELVKQSRFVITHASTSINFAVLFKKPVIFVTTNELKASFEGPWIDAIAYELGKKVYNLNEPIDIDLDSELCLNRKLYKSYKNNYIKMYGTPELPFWQVVADKLKTMEIKQC